MVVRVGSKQMYLWRAVDSEGEVLDLLVQSKRNTAAALRLMRKLLKKQGYAPDELVTDKLGSYGAARRELCLSCRHEQGLRKNNRASLFGRLKSSAFSVSVQGCNCPAGSCFSSESAHWPFLHGVGRMRGTI